MLKRLMSLVMVVFAVLFTSCGSKSIAVKNEQADPDGRIKEELKSLGYIDGETEPGKKEGKQSTDDKRIEDELQSLGYLK